MYVLSLGVRGLKGRYCKGLFAVPVNVNLFAVNARRIISRLCARGDLIHAT